MKPSDFIAASIPPASYLSLAQINDIAALIGTLVGVAYILWKWNREAKHHKK